MRQRPRDAEFEEFVRRRRPALLGTAAVLTAGDHFLAEDLVQGALVRLYLAWGRVRNDGRPEAYARRILVNGFIDHRRRPFVARERVSAEPPDGVQRTSEEDVDGELLGALAALPPKMRAAVVLRYVNDLSIEDTADALGCSVGNVKSQTSRALAKLRELLPQHAPVTTSNNASSTHPEGDLS